MSSRTHACLHCPDDDKFFRYSIENLPAGTEGIELGEWRLMEAHPFNGYPCRARCVYIGSRFDALWTCYQLKDGRQLVEQLNLPSFPIIDKPIRPTEAPKEKESSESSSISMASELVANKKKEERALKRALSYVNKAEENNSTGENLVDWTEKLYKTTTCGVCHKVSPDYYAMVSHLRREHYVSLARKSVKFQCAGCAEKFTTFGGAEFHVKYAFRKNRVGCKNKIEYVALEQLKEQKADQVMERADSGTMNDNLIADRATKSILKKGRMITEAEPTDRERDTTVVLKQKKSVTWDFRLVAVGKKDEKAVDNHEDNGIEKEEVEAESSTPMTCKRARRSEGAEKEMEKTTAGRKRSRGDDSELPVTTTGVNGEETEGEDSMKMIDESEKTGEAANEEPVEMLILHSMSHIPSLLNPDEELMDMTHEEAPDLAIEEDKPEAEEQEKEVDETEKEDKEEEKEADETAAEEPEEALEEILIEEEKTEEPKDTNDDEEETEKETEETDEEKEKREMADVMMLFGFLHSEEPGEVFVMEEQSEAADPAEVERGEEEEKEGEDDKEEQAAVDEPAQDPILEEILIEEETSAEENLKKTQEALKRSVEPKDTPDGVEETGKEAEKTEDAEKEKEMAEEEKDQRAGETPEKTREEVAMEEDHREAHENLTEVMPGEEEEEKEKEDEEKKDGKEEEVETPEAADVAMEEEEGEEEAVEEAKDEKEDDVQILPTIEDEEMEEMEDGEKKEEEKEKEMPIVDSAEVKKDQDCDCQEVIEVEEGEKKGDEKEETETPDFLNFDCKLCNTPNAVWHCTACEGFLVCTDCKKTHHAWHKMDEMPTSLDSVAQNAQKGVVDSLIAMANEGLKTLIHASSCETEHCTRNCHASKMKLDHIVACTKTPQCASCYECRMYINLCSLHSRKCAKEQCMLPLCNDIRKRRDGANTGAGSSV